MSRRDQLLYGFGLGGGAPPYPMSMSDSPRVQDLKLAGTALVTGQRGVVFGPPVRGTGPAISSAPLDRSALNAALLFWDVVEYPSNNMMEIGDPIVEELVALGAIQRSRVMMSGRFSGAEPFGLAGRQVIEALVARDPGQWSVWRQPGTIELGQSQTKTDAATVSLTQAIALPPIDAPFQEILEFRERRADQILALRARIDRLGAVVAAAADSERAFIIARDELAAELEAAHRVTAERWKVTSLASLDVSFDLTATLRAGFVAWGAMSAGAPPLITLGGAALAGLTACVKPRERRGGSGNPFDVVCALEREVSFRASSE